MKKYHLMKYVELAMYFADCNQCEIKTKMFTIHN